MTPHTLVTHSDKFHADDVLSYVVLSRLFPEAGLVRSRNPEDFQGGPRIVFDVGNVFNIKAGRFDHHQAGAPRRPDGTPYSAFGLIWDSFGYDYLAALLPDSPMDVLTEVWTELDGSLVHAIDRLDNGAPLESDDFSHPLSLPRLVDAMRPPEADAAPEDFDRAFLVAAGAITPILEGLVRRGAKIAEDTGVVRDIIKERTHENAVVLDRPRHWGDAVARSGCPIDYVVTPENGGWLLICVETEPGSLVSRRPLPEGWAGQSGEDLARATGVEDATFCHAGRFIAGTRSREGALALLAQAR